MAKKQPTEKNNREVVKNCQKQLYQKKLERLMISTLFVNESRPGYVKTLLQIAHCVLRLSFM